MPTKNLLQLSVFAPLAATADHLKMPNSTPRERVIAYTIETLRQKLEDALKNEALAGHLMISVDHVTE